ncbi:MAG: HEPN domain-containing protein [Candidatus Brocadia sp.]|nr:HEPN domain-containing protein [Candidatus Brocadia sp.]
MPERSADWIKQAERDIESARSQMNGGFYEWACFIAQQAAEKAVKAAYQKLGGEAWGHSVSELLKGLCEKTDTPQEVINIAKQLDKFYIPARYPNGWVSGTPSDYIAREDEDNAIGNSEKIIQFCKGILAR